MPRTKRSPAAADYAVLGLLREGPMHGYRLAQHFAPGQRLGLLYPLDQSAVYPLLHDLERRGLIAGRREEAGSRPTRTVFAITPAGEALLEAWLSAPVKPPRRLRLDFLLKLHFAAREDRTKAARLIAEQLAAGEHYLAGLDAELGSLTPNSLEHLTIESNRAAVAGILSWLRGKRDQLLAAGAEA